MVRVCESPMMLVAFYLLMICDDDVTLRRVFNVTLQLDFSDKHKKCVYGHATNVKCDELLLPSQPLRGWQQRLQLLPSPLLLLLDVHFEGCNGSFQVCASMDER